MNDVESLERQSVLADAQLAVAEELGWPLAILGAAVCQLQLDSWLASLATAGLTYWLATLRYRRRAAHAEDAYYRVAKLGKYVERQS